MRFLKRYIYTLSRMFWLVLRPMHIGVRILMLRDDQVLMVKHLYQREWYLPGGLVERGETLSQAARREAAEEVGAEIGDLSLFGAYTNFLAGKADHVIVFITQDFKLNGTIDKDEIDQWAFFDLASLPEKTSSGSKHRIEEYLYNQMPATGRW